MVTGQFANKCIPFFISKSLYGVRADGTVRFHSGFVAKINEATIKGTTYRSVNGDNMVHTNIAVTASCSIQSTLYAQMALAGMELFYDLQYQLSEYNATGNLVLWLPDTLFDLTIRKNLTSQRVTGTLAFLTTGNQNLMRVQTHPNNAYSQLTARELKQVASFRQSIIAAIETWNTVWQEQLDRALAEYEFPEMCYYCPT